MDRQTQLEHQRIGIQRARKNGVYHNNKLRLTPYSKDVKRAFYEYLNRSKNHMSIQRIADLNHMSRSSFYRVLTTSYSQLYNLSFRHNYHTSALSSWQGGKQHMLNTLIPLLPKQWDATKNRLYEPFCGMASLSFALQPTNLVLNDSNSDLMTLYQVVKDQPEKLCKIVNHMQIYTTEDYFYKIRSKYNKAKQTQFDNDVIRASYFLFLINNSFNGIVRYSKAGRINNAYNTRQNHTTVRLDTIKNDSKYLNSIDCYLLNTNYLDAFNQVEPHRNDLIYFDPPYDSSKDSVYSKGGFGIKDQINLGKEFSRLAKMGCYVMESNFDTPRVRALYHKFNVRPIKNSQSVNRNGKDRKRKFREVIITNY